jgi:hypothetical protein
MRTGLDANGAGPIGVPRRLRLGDQRAAASPMPNNNHGRLERRSSH